jgi:small subunit ribosomal protein S10
MNLDKKAKITIKLEAFSSELLNLACEQIIEKVKSTQAKIVGPIPLPIKKKIYCVLRSPHVNKDSREHFEIRKYSRILVIYPLSNLTTNLLLLINLPSGVKTRVNVS